MELRINKPEKHRENKYSLIELCGEKGSIRAETEIDFY